MSVCMNINCVSESECECKLCVCVCEMCEKMQLYRILADKAIISEHKHQLAQPR